ncbi:hypothetical protein SAMN05877753_11129 [Bacillus oleivorans]|uniref:Uncharacterized protein n=1 Tax=Bacillus oleivorans TaxID=1448271 RepID=A0A285D5Q0_9BACI|nr:hypothetical protein [Bacillus oleivorans]SNX75144.1 hypothetical protein SAMN05877753_11129 [Bacillus oleivorans]
MNEPKLHVWQPITELTNDIMHADLSFSDKGLYLKLIDIKGNEVSIIYDQISVTQDYVWTFRYTGEVVRSDLGKLAIDAVNKSESIDEKSLCFYKMSNSDLIKWFDGLPWMGSEEYPAVEHHIYCSNDGIFEVISEYEPKFIVKKKSETE